MVLRLHEHRKCFPRDARRLAGEASDCVGSRLQQSSALNLGGLTYLETNGAVWQGRLDKVTVSGLDVQTGQRVRVLDDLARDAVHVSEWFRFCVSVHKRSSNSVKERHA